MKSRGKRRTAALILAAAMVAGTAFTAYAGWEQSTDGRWWYQTEDGYSVGWKQIEDSWYFFDQYGWMATGWVKSDGHWYYMNRDTGVLERSVENSEDLPIDQETAALLMREAFDKAGLYPGALVRVYGEDESGILVSVGEEKAPGIFRSFVTYSVNKRTGEAVSKTGGPSISVRSIE